MELSRKINILRKLYFLGHISEKEIEAVNAQMVKEIKEEMREERNKNSKKVHIIKINELLSKNNIFPYEEDL